jgi:hypothetical protein
MTYEDAKELLHPLKLGSIDEFKELCKQGKLPNVPHDPYGLFKDRGWVDWADLLGYPRRRLRSTDRLPYQEAKKIIQSLKVTNQKQFQKLSSQKKLPKGIPGNPARIYRGKGWSDWANFLGREDVGWSVRRIKELLSDLIASNVISQWGSKEDEIVLYRILHTKGLLNIKDHNRHFEFFKNLPEAMHVSAAFKEIKEYADSDDYSRQETPPDLSKYTDYSKVENENEIVGTASTDELADLVKTKIGSGDPLARDGHSRIESPSEILKSIDRIESINVDEEVMRFIVIHSVNKIWGYIINEYDKGESNKDHISSVIEELSNSKNGNHYHDEVIDQFLCDYLGSIQIMHNLPRGYSFKYKPKIMQAYVAQKIRTRPHFLNLSGVGAGKTLSAILASRVIHNNKMTVVVCPNDIVEQWAENLMAVFPDSYVITGKEAFHVKRDEDKKQYLILNYDKFSLQDSPNLILELGKQKIDFVILDEIHFVKVRGRSQDEHERTRIVSQRHTMLVGLMTEIRQKNKHVN